MISHLAVVPTTPLLLPDTPGEQHPDVRRLAAAAQRVTAGLGEAEVVIALAGGPALHVVDAPDAELAGYGLVHLADHRVAPAPGGVITALREVLGEPAPEGARAHATGPDLRVLVRHVPTGTPVAGIEVPADTAAADAVVLGEVIVGLAEGLQVAVLVAGDLSAGHGPKPPRPTAAGVATMLDERVVAALDNGRPQDLAHLDDGLAADSAARAIGALRVLGVIARAARIGTVVRATGAPLGVGYVIAQGG